MSIFLSPDLKAIDHQVIRQVEELHGRLRVYSYGTPRRWMGSLRRISFAEAIRGSNSIEGLNVTMDEAIAIVDEEAPQDERTEARRAVEGYRLAMTYAMQAAADPHFKIDAQFLKSLHFMMTNYDMKNRPGHWRPGHVFVTDSRTEQVVYEAPDASVVDGLISELVSAISEPNQVSTLVHGAMAHLNLVMIHPFSDGNGRMSRALQTFIVMKSLTNLHPSFCSIEEWLGGNTSEYYELLGTVGMGQWNPQHDALPWIRFCLKAYHQQASKMLRRHEEYAALFERIEALVAEFKLTDRSTLPLFDTARGHRLTNARYRTGTEISEFLASKDLRRLCEVGLLTPIGEKRGRSYIASNLLKSEWSIARIRKPVVNPYDQAA